MAAGNINAALFGSYDEFFKRIRQASADDGNAMDALLAIAGKSGSGINPYIQNRRVKAISSIPVDYGKNDIAEMLRAPDENEEALRQVSHALEWGAYPYFKIRKTYQDVHTYKYYAYSPYITEEDAKSKEYGREAEIVDRINFAIKPKQAAHQIMGQALQEGKAAYIPRVSVDKAHKKVNYAFLQQVPSDWWKIVGFNNVSKYTVMFNLMYFLQPGADWRQFGDLFTPYLDNFSEILVPVEEVRRQKGVIYASRYTVRNAAGVSFYVDMEKFKSIRKNAAGNPQLYDQNGRWAYWVTLPVDKCWVFEIDDVNRTVATPFTGLFLAMDQIAAYEAVQLQIVQNPLISVVMGEIPYSKEIAPGVADSYLLSEAGRRLFLYYWAELLAQNNTGGIGAYFAPVQNMHLESLSEAPNATDISTKGYAYAVEKAGLAGLIPVTDDPKAGAVTISATLEESFGRCVYEQFSNMMHSIYGEQNFKYEWRFKMFGGFYTDEKLQEKALKGMDHGILSSTYTYLALNDISALEDLGMSRAVKASGIMDLRMPLITSYTASQKDSGLPPRSEANGGEGGRPETQIEDITSGGDISDKKEEGFDE